MSDHLQLGYNRPNRRGIEAIVPRTPETCHNRPMSNCRATCFSALAEFNCCFGIFFLSLLFFFSFCFLLLIVATTAEELFLFLFPLKCVRVVVCCVVCVFFFMLSLLLLLFSSSSLLLYLFSVFSAWFAERVVGLSMLCVSLCFLCAQKVFGRYLFQFEMPTSRFSLTDLLYTFVCYSHIHWNGGNNGRSFTHLYSTNVIALISSCFILLVFRFVLCRVVLSL